MRHAFLLLGTNQLQLRDSRLLILILLMLFKKLVKQHRVYLVVPHGVDVTFFVPHYEMGVYFLHVFRHEAELLCTCGINLLFVTKRYRFKRKERLAGFAHRDNLLLEPLRGGRGAELSISSHKNVRATGDCLAADASNDSGGDIGIADPDSVTLTLYAFNVGPDIDIVAVASTQVIAGILAQGSVGIPGTDVKKRVPTYRGI